MEHQREAGHAFMLFSKSCKGSYIYSRLTLKSKRGYKSTLILIRSKCISLVQEISGCQGLAGWIQLLNRLL